MLGPFAYEREVLHTSMLWFSEGFTRYYGWLLMARAGLSDEADTLSYLAETIRKLQESPGCNTMTVEQARWGVPGRSRRTRATATSITTGRGC